jgi:Eukaryotic aspartyl protease
MRLFFFIQTTCVLFFCAAGIVAVNTPGAINIPFSQVWYVSRQQTSHFLAELVYLAYRVRTSRNGNDGNWSSFPLTVGTPPSLVYVLPSTSATETWVVGWMGCNSSWNPFVPPDCENARGKTFNNQSTTWHRRGDYFLKAEEYLGINPSAEFGFDTVVVGYAGSGVGLSNTTAAWFLDNDFAVGMFGLSYRPTNFSLSPWDMTPSYLTQLYDQKIIPTLSYAYTAGAHYMFDQGIPGRGSLVLGGYDKSLFQPNNVVFPFNDDQSYDLTVRLEGIYVSNISASTNSTSNVKIRKNVSYLIRENANDTSSTVTTASTGVPSPLTRTLPLTIPTDMSLTIETSSSPTVAPSPTKAPSAVPSFTEQNLLPKPTPFFIDSTTPHIWLPEEACAMFEKAFGLVHDPVSDLYLINETQHSALVAQNSTIIFSLAGMGYPKPSVVNITFPYAAFDLWVTWGYNISAPTRYFPIRRAANNTQYVLGRTFLQEAYLIVDNTNQNFTISQRAWPLAGKSQIFPQPITTTHLAHAVIAAISVSGIVLLTFIASAIWYYLRRKRLAEEKKRKDEEEAAEAARKAKEKEEAIVPDPFATPDGIINELHTEKLETPELFGRLLPFNGAEVDGSHASERRFELGRGMEGIEGRHELEAPHGISQAPAPISEANESESENGNERKSVDVSETATSQEISERTETEEGTEIGSMSPMEPVSPESPGGSSRGLLGGDDPVSPQSPTPVKLQNDRHLIYGFI